MAYHVPQMIFDLVNDNKKQLGLKKLIAKGYDASVLSAEIDKLATSIDKLGAVAILLGKQTKSLDEIETFVANQPTDQATMVLSVPGTSLTVDTLVLASNAGFFATSQSGAEMDKKTGLPFASKSNEDAAFYQGVLSGIMAAKRPDDNDFSKVTFGNHTGFAGRLMFERSIPGKIRLDRESQLAYEILSFVLTDSKTGEILYFKPDNTIGDIDNGRPIYFLLKTTNPKNKDFEKHKAAIKASMMSMLDRTNMTPEQIENAEKEADKAISNQLEQIDAAKRKIRFGEPVPVDITGGFKGATQNVDNIVGEETRKNLTFPLSEFDVNDKAKQSIVFTVENVDGQPVNVPAIQFPNVDNLISLKNPNKIGEKAEDADILNNIVDILTQDIKVGDKAVPDIEKVDNVGQYIPLKAKNYTIGTSLVNGDQKLEINLGGNVLDLSDKEAARRVLKDFLGKNATIHFHKKSYDKNSYTVFKLTPDNGAFNVSKSDEDYYKFVSPRLYPRVVRDERTKLPMVLNGYFRFQPVVTAKEVANKVEEVTKEVVKEEVPVTKKQAEEDYDELLRSRLLESIVTLEEDAAAKAWWEESALSKAVDSTGKPLFTLNLLRNVANSEAWASFRDSVITLYEGGNYSHVYHEAWHAFSQTYLTYSERTKLYKEVSKLPGSFKVAKAIGQGNVELVDVEFSKAERKELEEFIAEEFRTYALNKGKFKTENEKTNIFKKIFDRIWKALKALVGGSTAINIYSNPGSEGVLGEIFNTLYTAKSQEQLLPYASNIKNGEFGLLNSGVVNTEHPEDVLSLSESLLVSKTIDGIISKATTERVQAGSFSAVSLIFRSPKELKKVYERALAELSDKREVFLKELKALPADKVVEKAVLDNKISVLTRATKPYMYGNITQILEGTNVTDSIIAFHRQNSEFKDMFVKFSISKEEAADLDEEQLENNLIGRNFDAGNSSTESEKLANELTVYIVKSLLKQNKDGSYVLNELGFPEPIEFKPFWRVMMDKCSGETSIMGLYNKIKTAGNTVSPLFKQLLDKIFKLKTITDVNGKEVTLSEEQSMAAFITEGSVTGEMWMKLVQSFNLFRIDLVNVNITQTDEGVEVKVGKSSAEYQNIIRNWQSAYQQKEADRHTAKNKDKVNYINTKNVVEDYIEKKYNDAGKLFVTVAKEDYVPFLNSIGINLSDTEEIREFLQPSDVRYLAETIVKIDDYINDIEKNYKGLEKEEKLKEIQKMISAPIDLFRTGKSLPNKEPITNSGGTVNSLANLEANFSEEYASGMRLTPNGEKKSVFSLNSTDTQKVRALQNAKQKGDLSSDHPEFMHMNYLNPANNPEVNGSVYMRSMFDPSGKRLSNEINIFDLSGSQFNVDRKDESSTVGITYSKMNATDKFISDFISTLTAGFMQGIVPGDKSSYYSLKIDNITTYTNKKTNYLFVDTSAFLKNKDGVNVAGYDGMDKTIEILYPKLEGEIRRIAMIKADPEYYKNIKGFEKGEEFTIFSEMLDSKDNLKEKLASAEFFKKFAESNMSLMDFLNMSDNLALKKKIDANIKTYFEKLVKEYNKNLFEKTFGKTAVLPSSINKTLSTIILKELDADKIQALGNNYNSNIKDAAMMSYMVNNFLHKTETTLLLQGDGFQFDHSKDETLKRTPGSQSGGRVFAVDKLTQHWVNTKVGRPLEEKLLKENAIKKENGSTEVTKYNGIYNTSIIKESQVGSVYFEMYRDLFKKMFKEKGLEGDALNIALYGQDKDGKIGTGARKANGTYDTYAGGKMDPYANIKDGDGQGWITFDSYRILKRIEGQWSNAQEDAYMKIVRGQVLGADELSDLFPVYKLQYNGNLATETGKYPVQAFHKFSLFPLIPTVIKNYPAEQMHLAMMQQNIDYALFESGSKRSHIKPSPTISGDVIYNNGDTSNILPKDEIKFTKNSVYVTYLKNQTDVNSTFKEFSTFSTQLRKLVPGGLYKNGLPIDYKGTKAQWNKLTDAQKRKESEFHNLVTNFKDSLDRLVYHEYKNLLDDLNWTEADVEKAVASPEAMQKMITFLIKELKEQGFSDHEISILQTDTNYNTIDFSISPLAARFEKLIMAVINNRLIRLKLKGEPLVEVSSALMQNTKFRNATREEQEKYNHFGTNGLPSYVVDLAGKKNTIGFGFKRALTEMDQNLFQTTYYVKNEKGQYVPALDKNNRKVKIAVYKTTKDENGKETKSLDIEASLDRLNEMLLVKEWKLDDENFKKLRLTGVRIPVQGDNSMEFGEVVEFLRPDAGPIIIIPAEIVAKSGTDFDVDKMTTYLPYITRTGKLLKDNLSEEALEKKIETLKEKLNKYKKTKEAIELFKTEKSAKWMDIGPSFNKFRKAIFKDVKTMNNTLSEEQLKALTGKNRDIIKTLEQPGMDAVLKKFKRAYKIYNSEIKGATLEDIKNVEEGLANMYEQKGELASVYDELSDAQEHKNNYISAIQNRLIDDIINILQLPAKAASLLSPNDTNIAKPIADTMKEYIQEADDETDYSKSLITGKKVSKGVVPGVIFREDYNNKKHQEFTVSKDSLGIAAVDNYINILLNQAGAKMNKSMANFGYVWNKNKGDYASSSDIILPIDLNLKHNKLDDAISLSHVIDSNDKHDIAEVINQLMNGFVDAGKDAWVAYLQGNTDVVPKILFMLEAGVPIEHIAAFVNNPISRAYVTEKNKQKSVFSKLIYGYQHIPGDSKKSVRTEMLQKIGLNFNFSPDTFANLVGIQDKYGKVTDTGNIHGFYNGLQELYEPEYFTEENLNAVAKQDADLSNKEQVAGFLQYLYIEDLIQDYDNMKKAFNPDTNKVSDLFSSQAKIEEVNAVAESRSLDYGIFDFIRNKSIIAPFFIQELARKLFSRLFKLRDSKIVNDFLLDQTKNYTKMTDIKKTTGYDTETYVIKFKNFLAQYIFANELRQYDPKSKTYKGRQISQAFLDQANKDFDEENYSIYSKSLDSYRSRGLAPINPAAFQFSRGSQDGEAYLKSVAKIRQDFIEFTLEREYLRRTVPMASLLNTKEFELRRTRLIETDQRVYQQTSTESQEEYDERLNKMTYEDYLANQALKNTYNIWQLFRSGDNTIARELMDIIQNYKEIGDNTNYSILQQFAPQGISSRSDLAGISNFQLKNYSNLDEGLINDYYNQWTNLANPGKFKILGENTQATKANAYVSNFFAKLPIYAFLQSGMDSSQFSLSSVMPYDKYKEIMERASGNFLSRLDKEDAKKILGGINELFVIENSVNRSKKPLRNRGLLVKQPTLNLPVAESNLYEQPFLKEVEPGIFEMDTYTMNGRTVTMDIDSSHMKSLIKNNEDTLFLMKTSQLYTYVNQYITPDEEQQAIFDYRVATDRLRAKFSKIVVNVNNFGGKKVAKVEPSTANIPGVETTKVIANPKIISDGDLAAFKMEVDKNKGTLPKTFFTNNNMTKWLLNSKNLYDLVDKVIGEIYLRDVNLETGISEAPLPAIKTAPAVPATTQPSTSVQTIQPGLDLYKNALTKEEQKEFYEFGKSVLEEHGYNPFPQYVMASAGQMEWSPEFVVNKEGEGVERKGNYNTNIQPIKQKLGGKDGNDKRWNYHYYLTNFDGSPITSIPTNIIKILEKITGQDMSDYDTVLINLYPKGRTLGWHQDITEDYRNMDRDIVSVSIGADADFTYINREKLAFTPKADFKPTGKVNLKSGDVMTFGDKSRLVQHTVSNVTGTTDLGSIDLNNSNVNQGFKGGLELDNNWRMNFTFRVADPNNNKGKRSKTTQPAVQPTTTDVEPDIINKKQELLKKINKAVRETNLTELLAEKGYDVTDIISNLQAATTQEDINKINKILDKLC
jgi:alkylated DNA repair dioxygenase AlkB